MKTKTIYARLFTFMFLFAFSAGVHAQNISFSMVLRSMEGAVAGYRYQVNHEREWITAEGAAPVITLENFNLADDVIYVQQTADGIKWSRSYLYSYNKAENTFKASIPEIQQVTESPSIDSINQVKFGVEIAGFAGGRADNIWVSSLFSSVPYEIRTRILPSVTADLVINNLVFSEENKASAGLRAGIGYQRHQTNPEFKNLHFIDIHVFTKLDIPIGSHLVTEIAIGGAAVMVPHGDLAELPIPNSGDTKISTLYGPAGQVNFRLRVFDELSLGLQAEWRFLFTEVSKPFELTGTVRAGFGYWFR